MKNKSGRVNSMKLKKAIAASLAISLLLAELMCEAAEKFEKK